MEKPAPAEKMTRLHACKILSEHSTYLLPACLVLSLRSTRTSPYHTTPWNIKSSYHDYRKVELSLKLKERNLLDSGTKAAMAERMQAFDDEQ
jgi:hypothetical protein